MNKQYINAHLGKRLRTRRTVLGLSQDSVAKSIGITFQQVQKYEKGSNEMGANRLYELSQLLRVPIGFFFTGIGKNVAEQQDNEPGCNTEEASSNRESLEIMKAFNRIKSPVIRKRLADLVRSVANGE